MPVPTAEGLPERSRHAALQPIAALVCKQGVSLGLLSIQDRRCALALAWSQLPQGVVHGEAAVNVSLRHMLDGPGRFLRTDHVELRRWLVDEGWLVRDGFGREYRALPPSALPPACQDVAAALSGIDVTAWVDGLLRDKRAAAERRRAVWSARQSADCN